LKSIWVRRMVPAVLPVKSLEILVRE